MNISKMDELILGGALEVTSITDSGEFTYSFTDKVKDAFPEVYEELQTHIAATILGFVDLGFLEILPGDDGGLVRLTDKAFDPKARDGLGEIDIINLDMIINGFATNFEG